jgi:extracellular elastinolytic metalloproteinase
MCTNGSRAARSTPAKAPSAQQRAVARGKTVRWNRFGTPQVLTGDGDYLATGLASDPVAAARSWLAGNTALLGIDRSAVADLQLLASAPIGKGRAVLFQQRFGGLPAGHDGLVVVGVVAGRVAYVSSSLAGGDLAGAASLSSTEVFRRAAASAGKSVGAVTRLGEADSWTTLRADGFASPQRIRLVALPIPDGGAVPAYEAIVLDGAVAEPLGASVFVDARSGAILIRESLVDDEGEPSWKVFPSSPSLDYSSADTRQLWCWTDAAGCDRALDPSSPDLEWDVNSGTGSSFTTDGNNANAVHNCSATTRSRSGPRRRRRVPHATTSTRGRTSGSSSAATPTRPSPRPCGTTSTPRGRTSSPCTTECTTGPTISASRNRPSTCRRTTSAEVGSGTTTSRATPRPEA